MTDYIWPSKQKRGSTPKLYNTTLQKTQTQKKEQIVEETVTLQHYNGHYNSKTVKLTLKSRQSVFNIVCYKAALQRTLQLKRGGQKHKHGNLTIQCHKKRKQKKGKPILKYLAGQSSSETLSLGS
jgi:hypothetical protein